MFKTTKGLLTAGVLSLALAGGLYWWWGQLIVGTFSQCIGGTPPPGTDCTHSLPMYAAIVFAALALLLLVAAAVRWVRTSSGAGRAA